MLACMWDDAFKNTLLLIGKSGSSGFPLSLSLPCLMPSIKCVEYIITVTEECLLLYIYIYFFFFFFLLPVGITHMMFVDS